MQYFNNNIAALNFNTKYNIKQAINNLQSSHIDFSFINDKNVFKIINLLYLMKVQAVIKAYYIGKIK